MWRRILGTTNSYKWGSIKPMLRHYLKEAGRIKSTSTIMQWTVSIQWWPIFITCPQITYHHLTCYVNKALIFFPRCQVFQIFQTRKYLHFCNDDMIWHGTGFDNETSLHPQWAFQLQPYCFKAWQHTWKTLNKFNKHNSSREQPSPPPDQTGAPMLPHLHPVHSLLTPRYC